MVVINNEEEALPPTPNISEPSSSSDESDEIEFEEVPVSADENAMEDLLEALEDYTPTVPDALTAHYLHSAGFDSCDPRIVRIISVAAQKFISDIANDALQHCKTRTTNSQHSSSHGSNKDKKNNPIKDRKYMLTVEDLTPALADHGLKMRKPNYFV